MAPGDIVSSISNIAVGARLTFQPAPGVEVLILMCGGRGASIGFYNGTIESEPLAQGDANNGGGLGFLDADGANKTSTAAARLPINNTNYLRIQNTGGVARNEFYTGIQIK